jgi:phage terminase large subunit-like protein
MTDTFAIDRAFTDQRLFSAALGDTNTWLVWLIILKAAFGLLLNEREREIFANVAGARNPPLHRVNELWCIAGRRSGKSRIAALVALFIALFCRHKLAPGEKGMVLVIAASVDQANTVFNYVRGFLEAAPALQKEVVAIRRHEIELRNGIVMTSTVTASTPCAAARWLLPCWMR